MNASNIPLSLYIHIPWCIKKCPYCDFNSHALKKPLNERAYIQRMISDLSQYRFLLSKRPLFSIFIGGGTPSLISDQAYRILLTEIAKLTDISSIEITLEANPGSIDQRYLEGYRHIGINRLSIGAQSFDPQKLQALGRIHQPEDIDYAIQKARQVGFDNINLDLMYGLPKQTAEQALFDLQLAIDFQPTHLSWYQLTLEPHTLFFAKPPPLPEDETMWEIEQQGKIKLLSSGFPAYEVSAYASLDYQCQHNLNYWQFGDYIGIGAGACGKITEQQEPLSIRRYANTRHPKHYLNTQERIVAHSHILKKTDIVLEFMLNALRLHQPITHKLFKQRTGMPIKTIQAMLEKAKQQGFMQLERSYFQLTPQGQRFLNNCLACFLIEE